MLELYGTFPSDAPLDPTAHAVDTARWAENAGLTGMLVFTDNQSPDPWVCAQLILERTTSVVPLVAVQPNYMHPYATARKVSTLALLYGRRVDLNMVTGSYAPDHSSLGCRLDHDRRYERLVEYTEIVTSLLHGGGRLTHSGRYYELFEADLQPRLPSGLDPTCFIAGNSPMAIAAARKLGVVRLTYPLRPHEYTGDERPLNRTGIRIGVIARDTTERAWCEAHRRFPPDPVGTAVRALTASQLDARWHDALWTRTGDVVGVEDMYWMHPFRSSQTYCPFLVGSQAEVAGFLAEYIRLGVSMLMLARPDTEDDLFHAVDTVRRAERLAQTTPSPAA
jgi:alkanesulfonate monooxygenase